VCVAVLQTGVVPPHCAFDTHGTQVAVATSQAGVAPLQRVVFVAEQIPHAPLDWHAGVAPPQSLSPPQARQVCVAALQIGVVPLHCAFDTHGTHTPPAVKQTGVAPPHCEPLVAEHCPHDPDGWQAGVAPPHSLSPVHARQVCVVVLHTGVVPPHCALETHGTHVAVAVKQTGVAPPHALALVAEHWPQAPDD